MIEMWFNVMNDLTFAWILFLFNNKMNEDKYSGFVSYCYVSVSSATGMVGTENITEWVNVVQVSFYMFSWNSSRKSLRRFWKLLTFHWSINYD